MRNTIGPRSLTIPTFLTFLQVTDPAAGGGGGAPGSGASPGAQPAGSGGATPGASPGAPAPGGGQPGGAPGGAAGAAAAAAQKYAYDQEFGGRRDWLPPDKFNEVHNAYRTASARARQLEAMMKAGTGVELPGIPEQVPPEIREARDAFGQVFPGVAALESHAQQIAEMPSRIEKLEQTITDLQQQLEFGWRRDGRQSLTSIQSAMSKELGVEKLSKFQSQVVGQAFQAFLESDETGALMDRYAYRDPTLYDEFINEWKSGFFDPMRRLGQAGDASVAGVNRNLPRAPAVGGLPPSRPPAQPLTEDQVHDNAFRSFDAAVRATQR
jgi:hypothetical protein